MLPEKTDYSLLEYLTLEREPLEKNEFHLGRIIQVDGNSILHGLLAANAGATIRNAIVREKRNYLTLNSSIKIQILNEICVYPDVVVSEIKPEDRTSETIDNPKLIVEVLSPSTSSYDRDGKFKAYQKIKSFQEYILISQEKIEVDVFFREPQSDFWLYRSYSSIDDVILLKSINAEVKVSELYLDWENPNS